MIFQFDDCVLDTSKQELWRAGQQVHVEPQVLAVLEYLAEHGDRVVTKIELLDEVWGDRYVSESALTSRIKLARRACGDSGREQRILKTIHSRGYRLVVPVTQGESPGRPSSDVPSSDPPTASSPTAPPATAPPATAASPLLPSSMREPAEPAVGSVRVTQPARPARASTSLGSVVGRDTELERLDQAFEAAAGGHRQAVYISGGAGTGKSTLIAEFLERRDDLDEWNVARGHCIQTRSVAEPFFCLLDALGSLARTDPDAVAATLERVAPGWLAQMPALVDHDTLDRLERRLLGTNPARMLREGADAFVALADRRPLAVVLEDLHWADDCTLDVLDLLLQRSDPARLLLLCTGRPDSATASSVLEPAEAGGRATVIELPPLDAGALAELARARFDGQVPPSGLVAAVERRSGGVPLFADEILSSWLRDGHVRVSEAGVEVVGDIAELEAAIPASLPPLIQRDLAGLDPADVELLEACAVAGDAFEAATVAVVLDQSLDATERALARLAESRGLIGALGAKAWPDGTISAAYAFAPQVVREVVDARIAPSRHASLHARVGLALETGYGDRAEEIAVALSEHAIEASDAVRAVKYLTLAGEQANARNAHAHAAGFLDEALAWLARLPGDTTAAELRLRMAYGPALAATKGWFDPAVAACYQRVLDLCEGDPTGPEAAAARYGLATVSELQGRFERTEALLTPLLAAEADGPLAIEAHELVACSMFHQGAFDRSLRTAKMVLESWDEHAYSVLMARIAEHPASSCSSWSSLASWALGRSDEALELAQRAVELGEQNLYALSTAVQQRAMLHQLRREVDACIEWADRCHQVGVDQGFVMRTIQAAIYRGWALGVAGRVEEGLALVADGLERFRAAGATLNEAYYLGMHAEVLLHAGQPSRALAELELASERSTSRTYFYEAELHRLRARALLAVGGDEARDHARRALDAGLAAADRQGAVALQLRCVTDRVELEDADGVSTAWRKRLAELVAHFDGQAPTPDIERAKQLL